MQKDDIVLHKKDKPTILFMITEEIQKVKTGVAVGFLRLGELLKYVKDEKLYKYGYETFPSFIAQFGFSYSSARAWIHIFELYKIKLRRDDEELRGATWGQLQTVAPVVEQDPEEWIGKATVLSRGDLINEVRKAQGKEEMEPRKASRDPINVTSYEDYVAASPCCVCGNEKIERAHFPQVKGRAARPWYYIPLCHDCHINNLHQYGVNHFLVLNRNKIFQFFYGYIEHVNKRL